MSEYSFRANSPKPPLRREHETLSNQQIKLDWTSIRNNAGPYPHEAFQFVREGLAHTVKMFHGDAASSAARHVSRPQLCVGLRDFAVTTYGMLARTVLCRWGVRSTDDFGR